MTQIFSLNYLAIGASAVALLLWVISFLTQRKLRREMENQGIKLIQLLNVHLEIKRDMEHAKQELRNWLQNELLENGASLGRPVAPEAPRPPAARFNPPTDPSAAEAEATGEEEVSSNEAATRIQVKSAKPKRPAPTAPAEDELEESEVEEVSEVERTAMEPRQESPAPPAPGKGVRLRVEFQSYDSFVRKIGRHLSKNGMFLPARKLYPVGTEILIDFSLEDGSPLLSGRGQVKRVLQRKGPVVEDSDAELHGMDILFTDLDGVSRETIKRVLNRQGAE